jgi:hypothetical protein
MQPSSRSAASEAHEMAYLGACRNQNSPTGSAEDAEFGLSFVPALMVKNSRRHSLIAR